MDNEPSMKGAWLRHVTRFKFGCPIHISGMAEARALNFLARCFFDIFFIFLMVDFLALVAQTLMEQYSPKFQDW